MASERLRYLAYALVAAGAAWAYFMLDADPGQERVRRSIQEDDLPELRLIERDTHHDTGRDLFLFAKNEGGIVETPPALTPPPEPLDTMDRKPDRLSDVQVLGLVRRPGSAKVLVKVGTSLADVPLGEPFGEGDLLRVKSIEGPNVVIEDSSSKNSRTFTLSEE